MKQLLYPKTYAIYLGTFLKEWKFAPTYRDYVHRFEAVETKEIIESEHFTRSGSTPKRLYNGMGMSLTESRTERKKRLTRVISPMMPIGTQVKLYQRAGRWHYRHMGQ